MFRGLKSHDFLAERKTIPMHNRTIFVDSISFDSGLYFLKEKFSMKIYSVTSDQLVNKFKSGHIKVTFLDNCN